MNNQQRSPDSISSSEFPRSSEDQDSFGNGNEAVSSAPVWQSDELGFFYPDLADKDCTGKDDIVIID